MKIAVITDSSSNLSLEYIESQKNLKMTPLLISYNGEFYRDLIEVDYETVYEKLDETKVTTSLPSLEDFENADLIMKNGFLLGAHHGMTLEDVDIVCDKIKEFFDR